MIVLVFTKPVDSQHQIVPILLRNKAKLEREIQKNAGRRIADSILSLSNQSERTKSTIHWYIRISDILKLTIDEN